MIPVDFDLWARMSVADLGGIAPALAERLLLLLERAWTGGVEYEREQCAKRGSK